VRIALFVSACLCGLAVAGPGFGQTPDPTNPGAPAPANPDGSVAKIGWSGCPVLMGKGI
jgi:hypothetical protein